MTEEYYEIYDPLPDNYFHKGENYMYLKKGDDRRDWPEIRKATIEIQWPDGTLSTHKIEGYRTEHFGYSDGYGAAFGVTLYYPKVTLKHSGATVKTDLSAIESIKARILD